MGCFYVAVYLKWNVIKYSQKNTKPSRPLARSTVGKGILLGICEL